MKILLTVTAYIEAGAGIALMGFPVDAVKLLLGSPLDSPVAVTLGRVGGAALFALGIGCWLARGDARSVAARGMAVAMTFYNLATVAILMFAAFGLKLSGVALWPAVVLHAVMGVGCIVCLGRKSVIKTGEITIGGSKP